MRTGRPVADKSGKSGAGRGARVSGRGGCDELDVADYDPQTKLFYVTAREQCDIFSTAPQAFERGPRLLRQRVFPER